MARIITWAPSEIKYNLANRLQDCIKDRKNIEFRWQENEQIVFNTRGGNLASSGVGYSSDVTATTMFNGVDQGDENIGINYTFKNFSYIHSQMASNPPSVIPEPTSNDFDDRRKADAADRLLRYARNEYKMQERVDMYTYNTLLYGTGIIKAVWDTDCGDVLDVDEETGELTMEGDFKITVPNPWDIYIDPDVQALDEVRYVFERKLIPYEEACFRWPHQAELLERFRFRDADTETGISLTKSMLKQPRYDVVEIYEYWEKGLPQNGYLGRFCICTRDGDLITELLPNPERYRRSKKASNSDRANFSSPASAQRHGGQTRGDTGIEVAVLPYEFLTDLDVPNSVWGKARVEYSTNIQHILNKLDSVTLEQAQAHGVPRLILPEGAEVADDSITNSTWDIIKYTGNNPPTYMEPSPIPPIIPELLQRYQTGINDMFGVNEAMFGQQTREQSGFSMQYAANQGNVIRYRLFNKYRASVENIYRAFLRIVTKHWTIPRTIYVLGEGKAGEAIDIKGADIDGGYDLSVKYGADFSLDPTTRREEILTLMPIFEKAGIDTRQILRMLKLNELGNMYDTLDLAADRQQEIFQEMISTGIYIAPEELQDHANMLKHSYYYVMTSEFKYLDNGDKSLIVRHIKDREQLAAHAAASGQGVPQDMQALGGNTPGPTPQGAAPGAVLPAVPGTTAPTDIAGSISGMQKGMPAAK